MAKKTSKIKRFVIDWEGEFQGVTIVEAFDEYDAEEQFDSLVTMDMIPQDEQLRARILWITPEKKARKGKKGPEKR